MGSEVDHLDRKMVHLGLTFKKSSETNDVWWRHLEVEVHGLPRLYLWDSVAISAIWQKQVKVNKNWIFRYTYSSSLIFIELAHIKKLPQPWEWEAPWVSTSIRQRLLSLEFQTNFKYQSKVDHLSKWSTVEFAF